MFENEVITEAWLREKGATEYLKKFYLNGYCQGHLVTLCFTRDAMDPSEIESWCIIDGDAQPIVWLPTNRVADFGGQRILLGRFWATVLILGATFKT